jgi:2-dehydro-3-deoxygluconokinase
MDLVTFGETMLRLSPPDHERLENTSTLDCRAAGAESNVAVAAGRLGAETVWLSKLPDSPLGRKVTATLRAQGTEPDVVWSKDGRQGLYFLEQGGAPRGSTVVYDREGSAVATATPAELPLERVDDAGVVYTSGITPALSEQLAETTGAFLERAQSAGATTALDVNHRANLWEPEVAREVLESLFPDVDVLFVAERDARAVLSRDGDAGEIAADLATEFDFGTVAVTRGDAGAVAWRNGKLHEQDAFAAETEDAIGTGDAFVGGYLARRVEGGDVESALAWGAATAALKRTIPGDVALVAREDVVEVLSGEGGGITR